MKHKMIIYGAALLALAGCGTKPTQVDYSRPDEISADSMAVNDSITIAMADTTTALDSAVTDSIKIDSSTTDTATIDTTIIDTLIADTTATDTADADTTIVPDTVSTDTATIDTAEIDTIDLKIEADKMFLYQEQSVNFKANKENVKWYFGDGDSAIEQNPTHTFNKAGIFNTRCHEADKDSLMDSLYLQVLFSNKNAIAMMESLLVENDYKKTEGIGEQGTYCINCPIDFGDNPGGTEKVDLAINRKDSMLDIILIEYWGSEDDSLSMDRKQQKADSVGIKLKVIPARSDNLFLKIIRSYM